MFCSIFLGNSAHARLNDEGMLAVDEKISGIKWPEEFSYFL